MHQLRYIVLIAFMTTSGFSMGFKGEMRKLFSKVKHVAEYIEPHVPGITNHVTKNLQSVEKKVYDVDRAYSSAKTPGVVARNIVYTAFLYSRDQGRYAAPKYKNEDLDHVLKNDFSFEFSLERFRDIAQRYDIEVTHSTDRTHQWNDLNGILALSNAVYTQDSLCSRKEIDQEIKQIVAIECLLSVNTDFLNRAHVKLNFDTRAFKFAENLRAQPRENFIPYMMEPNIMQVVELAAIAEAPLAAQNDLESIVAREENRRDINIVEAVIPAIVERESEAEHDRSHLEEIRDSRVSAARALAAAPQEGEEKVSSHSKNKDDAL